MEKLIVKCDSCSNDLEIFDTNGIYAQYCVWCKNKIVLEKNE